MDSPSHGYWYPCKCANKCLWRTTWSLLVYSCCTFWCLSGALLVHSRCIFGALLVQWCTPKVSRKGNASLPKGSLDLSFRNVLDRLSANLQTRKGIALLPKGSLDPPHRNVWIIFSPSCKPERELHYFRTEVSILCTETLDLLFVTLQTRKGIAPLPNGSLDSSDRNFWNVFPPTCKPERELHHFRKEASILRTETFGSSFHHLQTRKGDCTASERKSRSSAQKRLDRPRHYHVHY